MGGVRVVNRPDGTLIALFESIYRLQRLVSENPDWVLERLLTGV
jgi:hypothetical protein